ncbi:hypothetical protein [Telmatospirillum sp. J64-1]|uniref:hypothetical protein n=1 Tax=Telmatospirillum sp. J64-1 TaxID=2502183 RepID=UPI00163DE49C|nr:hypothetical protein [Telmatospirillum sp. J64-1]
MFEKIFPYDGTPFGAMWAAERWLAENGYSVGHSEKGSPRGILKGDYDIQKWRNLRPQDRAALDGEMIGGRDQDQIIRIHRNEPSSFQAEES